MVVNGTNRAERPVFEHKHLRTGDRNLRLRAEDTHVVVTAGFLGAGEAVLTPNDAIRIAAFLNRWFKEQNLAVIQAENAASKARRETKGK